MIRALVVWGNWGPYHYARFESLHRHGATLGIQFEGLELFSASNVYSWKAYSDHPAVHHLDFSGDETQFHPWLLFSRAAPLIFRLRPDVCFVPAYWHWSLFINIVSRVAGSRIVMMNDTHGGTERARGWKKRIKRLVVSAFHAGFVAGTPQTEYFASLGLPTSKISVGYDVVDNNYFSRVAATTRTNPATTRAQLGLPDKYFLSLGRFVEKKNLQTLIRAFSHLHITDEEPHHLVLVGSGEVEGDLRNLCDMLKIPMVDHSGSLPAGSQTQPDTSPRASVHFYGFRQINETPLFYALATAFILPSTQEEWGLVVNEAMASGLPVIVSSAAGCAYDLVKDNENGFIFDPSDTDTLVTKLQYLVDNPASASRMGSFSSDLIESWGCDRFSEGAISALYSALE